ncbi:hypothetical protein PsYK624_074330 [Phanerochaete sordida]|uniref:Uncharacterized protein n=1 Tax=Phanerochaete sordida TaxID=48140 RepID=A0A9P3LE59_9APHY|nr:hypothetical protein PsYK624_074330 [Phanerochaete sordida]
MKLDFDSSRDFPIWTRERPLRSAPVSARGGVALRDIIHAAIVEHRADVALSLSMGQRGLAQRAGQRRRDGIDFQQCLVAKRRGDLRRNLVELSGAACRTHALRHQRSRRFL